MGFCPVSERICTDPTPSAVEKGGLLGVCLDPSVLQIPHGLRVAEEAAAAHRPCAQGARLPLACPIPIPSHGPKRPWPHAPCAHRARAVRHPCGPRGGQPVPALHRQPQAARGLHRPATLLPPREGVQREPLPAGGEPLGLQRHQRPRQVGGRGAGRKAWGQGSQEGLPAGGVGRCVGLGAAAVRSRGSISLLHVWLRFSVSKRIFVVGFGLYGSIHGPTDYQVNIQVPTLAPGPRDIPPIRVSALCPPPW